MDRPDEPPATRGPAARDEFAHIQRRFDSRINATVAILHPGDFYIGAPGELLGTVLGSCVAACIRDARLRIGGMNHFMLPSQQGEDAAGGAGSTWPATRFGDVAMECLVAQILRRGGRRAELEVKFVGGGKVLDALSDVGARNIRFAREYARSCGLRVLGEDLGDRYPRKVLYDPASGAVRVKRLPRSGQQQLAEQVRYRRSAAGTCGADDLEAF
jgi:chemotaxis protein CheD